MLTKYIEVPYQPEKPLLIWDGDCGFCKYWMLWWRRLTGDKVQYEPYQKIAGDIKGIPTWAFQEAIRLVETDGKVYDGPHAAFQALEYTEKWSGFSEKYHKRSFFRFVSDHGYAFIAKNRPAMFFISKLLWGKNPSKPKKYWMIYIAVFLSVLLIFIVTI
jgi:predicted DCC family thiol-disulfide oxidoreductase YuxK